MILLKNVSKSFNDQIIIKDISARFERGKTNLVIGRSGSGKTVLLKTILGLHQADQGEIYYEGTEFTSLDRKKKKNIRKKTGMLFQGGALFDSATVLENVMYPLDMFTAMPYAEKKEKAENCLDRVNLKNVNDALPSELSGGMKKRVGIARAIALSPSFLFCDEPNSGLDPQTAILIDALIRDITKEFNTTTIINTHDMNSVMEMGEQIYFINHGGISWKGTRDDILESTNKDLNDFIFASGFAKKLKESLQ